MTQSIISIAEIVSAVDAEIKKLQQARTLIAMLGATASLHTATESKPASMGRVERSSTREEAESGAEKTPIFPLRMPNSTRQKATETASNHGVSLNRFITLAVVERLAKLDIVETPPAVVFS